VVATAAQRPEQFGPYLVYERLGAGGMATVHRAIKTGIEGFQRPVALKRLLSQYAGDQEFVRSFVREARLASKLTHPNIAQTFDLGRVDLTYYIAMELVDGVDLRTVLKHIAYSVGPMPAPIVLALGVQLCDALDYAHNVKDETGRPLGLVHRDVSPSNLLLGRDGVLKMIDFGIAKASTNTHYTASGILKGKFSYMAPESLDGHTDARSDLFAVGVILHELLTARPLFRGESDFDTLEQVKRLPSPPPSASSPSVPREVDQVVLTALQKNPTQRWQTAGQLRNALASLAAQPAMRVMPTDVWRWVEWALQQPARAHAWDEQPDASSPSIVIEADPATRMGAAPAPVVNGYAPTAAITPQAYAKTAAVMPEAYAATAAHAPAKTMIAPPAETAASRAQTLMVDDARPVFPIPAGAQRVGVPSAAGAQTIAAPNGLGPQMGAATMLAYGLTPGAAALPATVVNPLGSSEYQVAAAAYNAHEDQRRRMEGVVDLPVPALPSAARSGGGWILFVLILCAAAAVGGFFLVDALM
jgi:serine/threonine protein kinase